MHFAYVLRWMFAALLSFVAIGTSGAMFDGRPPPFIVTPPLVVERMMALAKVGPADTVMDLGSGDGRIVIHAAKQHNARGIGIEMLPHLVAESRRNAINAGVADKVRFIEQDALAADLGLATVLTLYLGPDLNLDLMPHILGKMRPGARVVSHDFGIGGWAPDATERFDVPEKNEGRGGESSIYLWIVPANAMGRWRAALGAGETARTIEFSIGQQFQSIEGAVHVGRNKLPMHAATLSADKIAFELPPGATRMSAAVAITARIEGDRMVGVLRGPGEQSAAFEARRIHTRPDL